MKALQNLAAPTGRIFLSAIFILSGINKIGGYDGTMQFRGGGDARAGWGRGQLKYDAQKISPPKTLLSHFPQAELLLLN